MRWTGERPGCIGRGSCRWRPARRGADGQYPTWIHVFRSLAFNQCISRLDPPWTFGWDREGREARRKELEEKYKNKRRTYIEKYKGGVPQQAGAPALQLADEDYLDV